MGSKLIDWERGLGGVRERKVCEVPLAVSFVSCVEVSGEGKSENPGRRRIEL